MASWHLNEFQAINEDNLKKGGRTGVFDNLRCLTKNANVGGLLAGGNRGRGGLAGMFGLGERDAAVLKGNKAVEEDFGDREM